jgi:hypothetical protein
VKDDIKIAHSDLEKIRAFLAVAVLQEPQSKGLGIP